MLKLLSFCSFLLLFAGAAFAQKKSKKPKLIHYQLGMTHQEVLQEEPGRSEVLLAEMKKPQGKLEVYRYNLVGKPEAKQDPYYLYYMNDTLIRKSEPEDMISGAEIAIKEYYVPLYTPKDAPKTDQKIERKERKERKQKDRSGRWKTRRD
ncbi:MAG: hypothetical protein JST36_07695 [Bacteroidetes bacterium]|nr:hypothetical protein [Bacteroidota bacterium]